jgi:Glycosyl transferase family 2
MTNLPLSILVPTYNSAATVPAHLESVRQWADLVEEIVVVDSFSTDGTLELLKAHLSHPNLRFLSHLRGLYQSWNAGIQQLHGRYTYISTQGDTITAEGLRHLAETAEELGSDVVISPPEFIAEDGRRISGRRWPIQKYLDWRGIAKPTRVEQWQVFLLATLDAPESALGSSASNLYRTETLQRYPFPTDYGHAGDAAWGIGHAFDVLVAVTPRVFSRFMLHPEADGSEHADQHLLASRLFDLARQIAGDLPAQPSAKAVPEQVLPLLSELPAELQKLRESQKRYDQARHGAWPWALSPAAWRARRLRNRQRQVVRQAKARLQLSFGPRRELWTNSDM